MSVFVKSCNVIAIIVTYNPDSDFVYKIKKYIDAFDKVVIVDNCSLSFNIPFVDDLIVINNKVNLGIAAALNIGIKKALEYSPKWIVTFDQDSIPGDNLLDCYNEALSKINDIDNFGVMAGGFNLLSDKIETPITINQSLILITSGMLHNVKIFEKVGFYNESLFIDSVDFDFVMRTRLAGFSTYRIENDIIKHKIGNPISRKIFGITFSSSNHNEIRRFYQGRNLIYLTRKYLTKFPKEILNMDYYFFFKVLPRMIIVERPLYCKLNALIKGLKCGLKISIK